MPASAVRPAVCYEQAFLTMLADFEQHGPHNTAFFAPAKRDFAAYVQQLLDEEHGRNLPAGGVPCTHRWLVTDAGGVVGTIRLRHRLATPFLAENLGHIGYDVAPAARRHGYGHLALRTAIAEAARLGLARVWLDTVADNAPSRAVIERAGGVLDASAYSEFWQARMCKYWLDVTTAP